MPFSAARPLMASRISRDMDLLLDQVGTLDVAVGDRDDPGVRGDGDLGVRGADDLAGEALVSFARVAGADARLAPHEAAEVRRLGQRTLGPRRGDLERVLLPHVGELAGDAL